MTTDHEAPESSRRQQKKAAKAEAAKAEEEAERAAAAAQKAAEKPAGWMASLTMAQVKALKQEESQKKHAAMHPPKPASDKAATKGASSIGPANENGNHSHTGKGKGKASQRDQNPIIPGCGLEGCPVEADHPPRPYVIHDYQLPTYIKKLYFQWPSRRDTEKVEQFLRVHEKAAPETPKWTTDW